MGHNQTIIAKELKHNKTDGYEDMVTEKKIGAEMEW
jgi:hypothetical protein